MAVAGLAEFGDILGFVDSSLSLISTISDQFPSQSDSQSTVRVGIGMGSDQGDPDSYGGNPPTIALYDDLGDFLGETDGDSGSSIDAGGFSDITVDQGDNNAPPTYIAIEAGGDDAVCISYIALTAPDQSHQAWTGDYGSNCGMSWTYSDARFGQNNHQPRCVWLDGDDSNELETQTIAMHIPDFNYHQKGLAQEFLNNTNAMCNSVPRLARYSGWDVNSNTLPVFNPPLTYTSSGADKDQNALWTAGDLHGGTGGTLIPYSSSTVTSKRSPQNSQINPELIVITNIVAHNVTELCNHPNSRGPSMANTLEGMFCDMASKQLWPICSDKTTCACLDIGQPRNTTTSVPAHKHVKKSKASKISTPRNGTAPHMRGQCGLRYRTVDDGEARNIPSVSFKKILDWSQ